MLGSGALLFVYFSKPYHFEIQSFFSLCRKVITFLLSSSLPSGTTGTQGREGCVLLPEMIPLGVAPGGCALDRKQHHPQMLPPAQPACLFHLIQDDVPSVFLLLPRHGCEQHIVSSVLDFCISWVAVKSRLLCELRHFISKYGYLLSVFKCFFLHGS